VDNSRLRFDAVVALVVAGAVGVLAFFLVGMEVLLWTLLVVPYLGALLLWGTAAGALWLMLRGRASAKGFGGGMLVGWVLLALWSSGMSLGFYG
jgi:hypothetical protein